MNKKNVVLGMIIFIIFNIFSRLMIPYYPMGDLVLHNVLAVIWFLLLGYLHVAIVKTNSNLVCFLPIYWIVELIRILYVTESIHPSWINYSVYLKVANTIHKMLTPLWGGDYLLSLPYCYTSLITYNDIPSFWLLHHMIRLFISLLGIIICTVYILKIRNRN